MAVGWPTAGEGSFVTYQYKLFALNIIVIVDFLFLKHFFYAKNEDKIACFCLFSWTLRTGISSFAKENIKIPPKSGFVVAVWDVEISGNYQWWQSLSRWSPAFWFEIVS